MKANELMVGDLVYSAFSDIPCKVKYLELRESGYGSVKTSNVDGIKDIASLYPIPLTPEILEKNWFEWHDNEAKFFVNTWCLEGFMLKPTIDGNTFLIVSCNDYDDEGTNSTLFRIKYLHELQHALKLCGIEKQIEL